MGDDIDKPGWAILRDIEEFNRAARERIMDLQYTSAHRERLKSMRDKLNDIEIELRDLLG